MTNKSDSFDKPEQSDKTVVKPQPAVVSENYQLDEATVVRPLAPVEHDATVMSRPAVLLPVDQAQSDQLVVGNAVASDVAGAQTGAQRIKVGSVINNRFVIVKHLGEGGMGVVYRALDKRKEEADDKDPHVALKILGKAVEDHPQAFIALQRETRKSQTLAHPNIITVYDFDRDGGVVYMTMEELHGKTLDQYIRENPQGLPQEKAFHFIKSIAQGLAYAHSKGIVHSDLKPGNVFITDKEEVKILDFGIARAVSSSADEESDKTVFDAKVFGGLTPSYASTEMFAGKAPHASDDMYALGLIAYELLTGIHPYQRMPASKAVNEKLAAARLKGIKGHRAKALLAAVALQRDDRVQSADDFLKEFDKSRKSAVVIGLSAALVVTVVVIGLFLSGFWGSDPDLPEQLQVNISQFVAAGNNAIIEGDYDAALTSYVRAYDVYPENPEALAGFDTLVAALLDSDLDRLDESVRLERLRQVNILVQHSSQLGNQALLDLRDKLQQYLRFTTK